MTNLVFIWFALTFVLLLITAGRETGGALVLAYFVSLSVIHVPGALLFVDPQSPLPDRDETTIGFELTLIGMASFVVGAALARMRNGSIAVPVLPQLAEHIQPQIWPMIFA